MKKNLFIKIILVLLVVLLAFSVFACGKNPPKDDYIDPSVTEKDMKMEDISNFLGKFAPLAKQIDLIEDEIHFDLALSLKYQAMQYSVQLQGDIYGDAPASNKMAIIVRDDALASDNIKLAAYLKDGDIYLNQKITSTAGATKFSKLDALELNNNLSKLPGMLNEMGLGVEGIISNLQTVLLDLGQLADGILKENKALSITEETGTYTLSIIPEGLGGLITSIVPTFFKNGFGELQGLIDFALDFIFGVDSIEKLETAKVANFPTIQIVALKEKNEANANANGLKIYYKGDLDKTTSAQEELEIGILANVDNDAVLPGTKAISFPDFTNYKEGVLKASLTIDLGVKDIYLKADVFADPDFADKQTNPTAYLAAYDKEGDKIDDLDAFYDGEFLYFDLAGLYTILEVTPDAAIGTQYKIAFDFPPTNEVVAPQTAAGEEVVEDEAELPFKFNPNFLTVMLGKIDTLIDIFKDVALEQKLSISVSDIMDLVDGMLVVNSPSVYIVDGVKITAVADLEDLLHIHAKTYSSTKTYTAAEKTTLVKSLLKDKLSRDVILKDFLEKDSKGKAYNDAEKEAAALDDIYNLLDKLNSTEMYGKAAIIAGLNKLLAPFATGYDDADAESYTAAELKTFAQAVIKTFSGVDVSIDDIINAPETSDDVFIFFGLLENGLGLELDISTDANKATKVLNVKIELDIVAEAPTYVLPTKDYTDAIDLNSVATEDTVGNIYFEGEEKHYVILDELVRLLDAYKAIGA